MDAAKEPSLRTPADPRPAPRTDGVIAQLTTLLRALGGSRRRGQLVLLALGVVVVIGANAAGQIRLNRWQGAFVPVHGFETPICAYAAMGTGPPCSART
jgi:ABC-type uncharacterized transport system fused permease/ATPase subunit